MDSRTEKKEKSRHLSLYEFLVILQKEYIVAVLRAKIYPKKKDKDFWSRTAEGKKASILNISESNSLPTIFTDESLMQEFEKEIIKNESFPNFIYKNEENKKLQEYYDLLYYYNIGSEVRFDLFGEIKVGVVKSYKPYQTTIIVTTLDTKEDISFNINKVTRIL